MVEHYETKNKQQSHNKNETLIDLNNSNKYKYK